MTSFLQLLAVGAATAFLLFTVTWLLSRRLDNYSFVDVTWSYSLAVIAPVYALCSEGSGARRVIALVMACLWSFRLGTYLLLRIASHHPHEDVRYQVLRAKWEGHLGSRFFAFFQAQALLIVLLSIPILLAFLNPTPRLSLWEILGAAVWLIGILGESVADAQMKRFKSDASNKGKVCNIGLWRYSRHPNYFFESVIWWGFWLFACGSPWGWVTVYAPLMILYFLLRVTGIPLTEKCSLESKGDAYRDYQRTTSAFIPWFPKQAKASKS
jgi:steroid 5-alpha reductase family enzyme